MTMLRELYQEVILDHGRRPRNFHADTSANFVKEGFNPLCGDKVTVYLNESDNVIHSVSFQGCGCAISMASASLMTEAVKGKTVAQVQDLFQSFHHVVTGYSREEEKLGKLAVLAGVAEFPARVKCATLAWHTLLGALKHDNKSVTTE